jgi:hypothetical protein
VPPSSQEEALIGRDTSGLVEWVAQQPSWSDFPFIVLLEPGASAEAVSQERDGAAASAVIEGKAPNPGR